MARVELLVVAWDGVSPDTIAKLMGEGTLPVLRDLLGGFSVRSIRSTVPPVTANAWTSFHLGVNPGKHGILDFLHRHPGMPPRVVSSRDFPYPTFWEVLAEDLPVGVVGFPLGYPPRPLARGFWVPGFLAPKGAASFPPEALAIARREGYAFNPPMWFPGKRWVEDLKRNVRAKTAASLALAQRYKPLLLGIHYQETDTVQHFLWGSSEMEELFAAADAELGVLLEGLSPRAVLLLSDHGMGPLRWDFHLNTWLLREGLLILRRSPFTRLRRRLFDLGLCPRTFQGMGERVASFLGNLFRLPSLEALWHRADFGTGVFLSYRDVDWERSTVYPFGAMGTLSLNRGAEKAVDRLLERLLELRAPDGERAVEKVFTRTELYWGERVHLLPDLFFLTRRMEILPVSSSLFLYHRPFSSPSVPGNHRMEGFLATNAALEVYENMPIWEIASAILAYFNKPAPGYMDVPSP